MNVFYEEDGGFKIGAIVADHESSLHVETPHGKRGKIKAGAVLLRFEKPGLSEFMGLAQKLADELDENFLWESCTPREFLFNDLANDYFGHAPSAVEAAGVLLKLHSAPMYFYKKGKGHYKAAPVDALKSALASSEKKRALALKQEQFIQQLLRSELPEEFRSQIDDLLYRPQSNIVEHRALAAACVQTGLSPAKLFDKCGALPSSHDYHLNRLIYEHFPAGTDFGQATPPSALPELTRSAVKAFSIDDATTTEIDDAFSVTPIAGGGWCIGIHIAAPALGFIPGSEIDALALARMSTVYFPSGKLTMLPPAVIQRFTLLENQPRPVLSMYLEVDADFLVRSNRTKIEEIYVSTNLTREELENDFDEAVFCGDCSHRPWGNELKALWALTCRLSALRGNIEPFDVNRVEYSIVVNDEKVSISQRRRGSPIDKIVSELMIFVNTEWGKQLMDNDVPAIYRSQYEGKVRMTTVPAPHQGLGVSQYLWASSPLRRYVDLVNQWQLISWLNCEPIPFQKNSEALFSAIRNFELAYSAYYELQRTMERYWCLRWLLQENLNTLTAVVSKENIIRVDGLPLHTRLSSLPVLAPGTKIEIAISNVDLLDLSFACQFECVIQDQI